MGTEPKTILTVNAGSSSLKLVLFTAKPLKSVLEATVTNIGQPQATLTVSKLLETAQSQPIQAGDHTEAISSVFTHLAEHLSSDRLAAIGHRIVHGGPTFNEAVVLSTDVIEQLRSMSPFDPEHMPLALELIEVFGQRFPHTTQIACFDTTFYRDLPEIARLLPLPRKFEAFGLRRYGFHGLSYEYLLGSFRESAGEEAANGRIILAHLGSGASLTALKGGKVLDTTMSFTPASGIPMSTRSGDLDPGIVDFLHRRAGITSEAFNHMVHFESGLLGVSELSADMELLIKQADNNPQAADAVDLFCYQTGKAIGSLTAVLGGLDSLIFAGGIGENAPLIRTHICERFEYLGLALDAQRNQAHNFLISADGSRVGVHVMHTDEAAVIAAQTQQTLAKGNHE